MFCPTCGTSNPDGTAFCCGCGAPLPVREPNDQPNAQDGPAYVAPQAQMPVNATTPYPADAHRPAAETHDAADDAAPQHKAKKISKLPIVLVSLALVAGIGGAGWWFFGRGQLPELPKLPEVSDVVPWLGSKDADVDKQGKAGDVAQGKAASTVKPVELTEEGGAQEDSDLIGTWEGMLRQDEKSGNECHGAQDLPLVVEFKKVNGKQITVDMTVCYHNHGRRGESSDAEDKQLVYKDVKVLDEGGKFTYRGDVSSYNKEAQLEISVWWDDDGMYGNVWQTCPNDGSSNESNDPFELFHN